MTLMRWLFIWASWNQPTKPKELNLEDHSQFLGGKIGKQKREEADGSNKRIKQKLSHVLMVEIFYSEVVMFPFVTL